MAMKTKSNDLEVAPEPPSEQQLRKAAKAALKKADRFWRLAEKAPSVNYREHHMKRRRTPPQYRLKKRAKPTRCGQEAHEKRNAAPVSQ